MRRRGRLLKEQEWVSSKSNWKIIHVFMLRVCLFCECGKVIQCIMRSFVCGCEISLIFVVCERMALIILIEALWLWVCVCERFCLWCFCHYLCDNDCNPYPKCFHESKRERTNTSEKYITLPGFEWSAHLHEHFNTSTKNFKITIKTIK